MTVTHISDSRKRCHSKMGCLLGIDDVLMKKLEGVLASKVKYSQLLVGCYFLVGLR